MIPIIELTGVTKVYKVKDEPDVVALRSLDLSVMPGEFLSICGVSGSGKTTLLNLIACLDKPTSGTILIDGNDTSKMNNSQLAQMRNKKVSIVLQDFGLINSRSVYDNVLVPFYFSRDKVSKKERHDRIISSLEKVGIAELVNRPVKKLSGGQRQRVAIARAIVNDTPIILADEPTGQLDSKTKKEIADLLIELNQMGKTIILVTHDDELASMANRTIHIIDGQIR